MSPHRVRSQTPERIHGFDVARAFAVFGMVLVNFKVVMTGPEPAAGLLGAMVGLAEGKAAATFVVLAGVGVALLTAGATGDRHGVHVARHRLFRRASFLFVVGLAYVPLWPGDILHFYGVYLAVAAWMIGARDRDLWLGVATVNVVFVTLLLGLDYERGWDWGSLEYTDFWSLRGMVRHLFFNGFHPAFPWLSFLFVGLWLGRRDPTAPRFARRLLAAGVGLLVAGSAVSAWLVRATAGNGLSTGDAEALFGTGPMPPNPLYVVVGVGAALTTIAISLALAAGLRGRLPVEALAATGQLSLTLYVAHVVIGMGALAAAGSLEGQTIGKSVLAAAIFSTVGTLFAWGWRRRYRRGPLEALMRRITS